MTRSLWRGLDWVTRDHRRAGKRKAELRDRYNKPHYHPDDPRTEYYYRPVRRYDESENGRDEQLDEKDPSWGDYNKLLSQHTELPTGYYQSSGGYGKSVTKDNKLSTGNYQWWSGYDTPVTPRDEVQTQSAGKPQQPPENLLSELGDSEFEGTERGLSITNVDCVASYSWANIRDPPTILVPGQCHRGPSCLQRAELTSLRISACLVSPFEAGAAWSGY